MLGSVKNRIAILFVIGYHIGFLCNLYGNLDWGGGASKFQTAEGEPLSSGTAVLLSVHQGNVINFSHFIPLTYSDLFTPGTKLDDGENINTVLAVSDLFFSGLLLLLSVPDLPTSTQTGFGVRANEKLYLLVWDQDTFNDGKQRQIVRLPSFNFILREI